MPYNWFMRRLRQHQVSDDDLEEARQAALVAHQMLMDVAARGGEVTRVSKQLRLHRDGFGELLTQAMHVRPQK